MILTIIAVIAIAVGAILLLKDECGVGAIYGLGLFLTVGGILMAFVMALCIILNHVGIDATIERNRIKYESLCHRYEIVTSEYEDVSKSDVIKDLAEWNMDAYSYKHWANNPWTSWFYSKRVADDMKMIEMEGSEVTE